MMFRASESYRYRGPKNQQNETEGFTPKNRNLTKPETGYGIAIFETAMA